MDLKQLRTLSAIAKSQNVSKAARDMRVTQPALGQHIRKLEAELGVDLVSRHSRGVDLTEAGRLLHTYAERILQEVEAATLAVKDFGQRPQGTVRLGMTEVTSTILAGPLVRRVARETPDIRLQIVTEMSSVVMEWIAQDRLDLALAYNVTPAPGLRCEPLLEEALFYVEQAEQASTPRTPSPFDDPISFAEVATRPLIMPGLPHTLRKRLDDMSKSLGLHLNIPHEVQSVATVRELIIQGIAGSILPFGAVRTDVEAGYLTARRIVAPAIGRQLYFVLSDRRPLSKAQLAIKALLHDAIARELSHNTGYWFALQKGA